MPISQELDAVIRSVALETPFDASCQVLVPLDPHTGQAVRPGPWSRGKSRWRAFLVTNTHRTDAVAVRRNLKIGVEDFSQDWHFDLLLDYEAKCSPGRETRVALALWQGASPQERLEALLKRWVLQALESQGSDFMRNFDRAAARLSEELRARALDQTGLTLSVRLRLPGPDRLDPLRIGPTVLSLPLRDGDEAVDLRFETELVVETGREQVAFLYRDRQAALEKDVLRRVREHFAASVTLQQFHGDLQTRLQDDLWRLLDETVKPYGRQVMRLSLGGEAFPGVEESKRIEHSFSHRPYDYPQTVEVKTELLLQLADLGRYVRAKAPDLDSWAAVEVENAAIQSLFGVTYTDLCLRYEEKKAEIEQRMKAKAAAIGYVLQQLTTITDLELDVLRRPFLVQLAEEFATQQAKLEVGLEVNATLVVPRPSEIAPLLDRQVDVKAQIRRTLIDRIQQTLHQVHPERFYMEFETSRMGDSIPVRAQLEAMIRETLDREFHADVLSLSCKQLDTELSLLLERLMASPHRFSVEVFIAGGGILCFDGSFRVTGADEKGWVEFQVSRPESERLCDCAVQHLKSILADQALGKLLQTRNVEQRSEVNRWLQERFVDEFGLKVRVMDWLRRPLPIETLAAGTRQSTAVAVIAEQGMQITHAQEMRKLSDVQQIAAANSRSIQLQKLQEQLGRALLSGGSEEEENELRQKIARLQEEQREALSRVAADRSQGILPRLLEAQGLLVGAEPAAPTAAEKQVGGSKAKEEG